MAKTDARLDVTRNPRTEDELANLRALRELRKEHKGILYTGSRKNVVEVDGNAVDTTRYVFEVDLATMHRIAKMLAGEVGTAWDPTAVMEPVNVKGTPVTKRAAQALKAKQAKDTQPAKPQRTSGAKSGAQKAPAKPASRARKAASK